MKVIVLGSGVIGVCSAWYLAKKGYEVTVIDRQKSPGSETSFANAGELSYGHAAPWAGPGVPFQHGVPPILKLLCHSQIQKTVLLLLS